MRFLAINVPKHPRFKKIILIKNNIFPNEGGFSQARSHIIIPILLYRYYSTIVNISHIIHQSHKILEKIQYESKNFHLREIP